MKMSSCVQQGKQERRILSHLSNGCVTCTNASVQQAAQKVEQTILFVQIWNWNRALGNSCHNNRYSQHNRVSTSTKSWPWAKASFLPGRPECGEALIPCKLQILTLPSFKPPSGLFLDKMAQWKVMLYCSFGTAAERTGEWPHCSPSHTHRHGLLPQHQHPAQTAPASPCQGEAAIRHVKVLAIAKGIRLN